MGSPHCQICYHDSDVTVRATFLRVRFVQMSIGKGSHQTIYSFKLVTGRRVKSSRITFINRNYIHSIITHFNQVFWIRGWEEKDSNLHFLWSLVLGRVPKGSWECSMAAIECELSLKSPVSDQTENLNWKLIDSNWGAHRVACACMCDS